MLDEIRKLLDGIRVDTRKVVEEMTRRHLNIERYDVTTAPDGSVIGVTLPFGGTELKIPYSPWCSAATVGDTVLVVWWNSLSTAQAWFMGNGWVNKLISILPGRGGIAVNGTVSVQGTATVGGAIIADRGAVELYPPEGATFGGYIDFHYGRSQVDHTARIIEQEQGVLDLRPAISINSEPVAAHVLAVEANGNWKFRRWSDGFCEATYSNSNLGEVPIATASGTLYRSAEISLPFPGEFLTVNAFYVTAYHTSAYAWPSVWRGNNAVNMVLMAPASYPSGVMRLQVRLEGTWR